MTRVVHLYPFPASRSDGGSLRLKRAVRSAPSEAWTFTNGQWDPVPVDAIAAQGANSQPPLAEMSSPQQQLKRMVFPSTLWESGRRPRKAARALLAEIEPDATVVLHTTYLLPLANGLLKTGATVIVDAYDLVWRAHAIEARGFLAPIRAIYSASVCAREMPALARVHAVAVAGYGDWMRIRGRTPLSRWIPTGISVPSRINSNKRDGSILRIGFLGNFSHRPTRDTADALMTVKTVTRRAAVVIGGFGSEAWARGRGVDALGTVKQPADFYDQVDVVVAPVVSGAGMKVKLAEAILFGKPTVTTPLGLDGFSPRLRRHLKVVTDARELSAEVLEAYAARFDVAAARADFSAAFAADRVEAEYRALLNLVR